MNVAITYCTQWNYEPRASSLAAEIKEILGIDSNLIGGGGGVFDIEVNGETIFSKHQENDQFPEMDDVIKRIKSLQT